MSDVTAFKADLEKSIVHLRQEYAKLQTGRASSFLVESVQVEAYGQKQPLKNVASISVPDARTILIQPWDKTVLKDVEKALQIADIGSNPVNEGTQIRLSLPPMTEERRKQLVKHVKELAEEARIAIRQHRQEYHKNAKKDESRTEDEHRDFENALQEEVGTANEQIDDIAKKKEEEVMTV